jgi:hypothetical protein
LVTATVVAPRRLASARKSTVSVVDPVCETPTATSPDRSTAAAVSAACGSLHTSDTRPIRLSLWWKSAATSPDAPTPYRSTRRACTSASTTAANALMSSWSAVSSMALASANATLRASMARSSPGAISPPSSRSWLASGPAVAAASASRSSG